MTKIRGAFLRWGIMGAFSKCSDCPCAFYPSIPTWRSQEEPHSAMFSETELHHGDASLQSDLERPRLSIPF